MKNFKSKILLVDDEENALRALERILHNQKYEIFTANSGPAALDIIEENDIHVIISDYRMPEMNGVELLKKVRISNPNTLRIMLTGHADINNTLAAINDGYVFKFFTKPVNKTLFLEEINNAFSLYDLTIKRQSLNDILGQKNENLIEEIKRLNKTINDITQQLIHADKAASLGHLAGEIGHEIKNVLFQLSMRIELLDDKLKNNKNVEDIIPKLFQNLKRMDTFSNNLLTMAKPVQPNYTKLDLVIELENSLRSLLETRILKGYAVTKEYQIKSVPVTGDSSQINQIFTNLLINAHHAMNGHGELMIEIKYSEDNKYFEVGIKDTGKGVPEDDHNKIFEPFYTTKADGKGTGLGLSVVKKIIESYKGYINIKSALNVGTLMTVGFPKNANQQIC